jgi:hypothetical protein
MFKWQGKEYFEDGGCKRGRKLKCGAEASVSICVRMLLGVSFSRILTLCTGC